MSSMRRISTRLLFIVIITWTALYMNFLWTKINPNKNEWILNSYPLHTHPHLQYTTNITNATIHGKPFLVDKTLMSRIQLNWDRKDFISADSLDPYDFVIATASDSAHYGGLYSMVASIHLYLPQTKIIIYDLGLRPYELEEIKSGCNIVIRNFDFDLFPPHVKMLRKYAWKPLMIHEVLSDHPAVLWLDTSVRSKFNDYHFVHRQLNQSDGFLFFMGTTYSLFSVTHPTMYQYIPTDQLNIRQNNQYEAGQMMFYRTQSVYRNILYWWTLCALDENCIAPTWNSFCIFELLYFKDYIFCHKFDQSALNILVGNAYDFKSHYYKARTRVLRVVRHGPKEGKIKNDKCE